MPTYRVKAPDGRTVKLTGDQPPTEAELQHIFAALPVQTSATAAETPPPLTASIGERIQSRVGGMARGLVDPMIGASKGALSTASGIAKLVLPEAAEQAVSRARQATGLPPVSEMTTPRNASQSIGKGVEQVAEFMVPGALATKGAKALSTGIKLVDLMSAASLQGATAAGVHSAQKGSTEGAGAAALTAGGLSAAGSVAAKPLGWLGERIERALLKPTKAGSEGLTPSQLVKKVYQYKLGGTLQQTYDKTEQAIDTTHKALEQVLSSKPGATVNIAKAFVDTADDIQRGALRTVGTNEELDRALEKISRELSKVVPPSGLVDPPDANRIKQGIGDLGAWTHNPATGKIQFDADAKALNIVADRLYGHLKSGIEQSVQSGPIAALNKKLGDLITIRRAVVHRIPVAERANVLNLGDLIGLSTGTFWVTVGNRLLQSGRVANAAVKAGQALPTAAPVAGQVAAGQVP